MIRFRLGILPAGFLLASVLMFADEWPAPQIREVFSPNRDHFVRITPGTSWGDTFGFGGSPKGPHARAEFYHRRRDGSYAPGATVSLPNPVAPVEFFVTDKGNLATVDNWHNVGYGKALCLYSPDGAPICAYTLADLFSEREIERFDHSASSILWHTGAVYLQVDQKVAYILIDTKGRGLGLNTATGAYQYCEWQGKDFLCRDHNQDRIWRPFSVGE